MDSVVAQVNEKMILMSMRDTKKAKIEVQLCRSRDVARSGPGIDSRGEPGPMLDYGNGWSSKRR
jgi:hypothetical protein